jgi:O-antigen/teichoic acid export membrane protein
MLPVLNSLKNNILRNKILVENFTFLGVLQVSNLILFIITIPYLFRVLGSATYGLIIFAQTVVYYFTIFINFGFNLTATRDISVNRDDMSKVSEIVSSVLTLKTLFFLLSLISMILLTLTIPVFRDYRYLFLFSMLAGLSEALFPVWFFQGIEKMKYIMLINIFTRILATILVFVVIKVPGDYFYYPLIVGSGAFSGALIALYVVFFRYRVHLKILDRSALLTGFRNNLLYFLSNVSTQLYINANRLVVGTFLGMVEIAYYDLADKIVNIAKVPLSILGQTLFPRMAREKSFSFLKRIMLFTVMFTVIAVTGITIFSHSIIELLSGSVNIDSINVLRILSLSLIPISISLFYGDLLLVNFGLKSQYAIMRFFGLLFYLALFLILYINDSLGIQHVAFIVVAVETLMTIYSFLLSRKNSLV